MWSWMPQVIGASDDGKEYGTDDAQLQLENGTPRSALPIIMLRCALMATMGPLRHRMCRAMLRTAPAFRLRCS